MKTAISIPDELFEAAEAAARRLGMSRSRLYSEAIAAYLKDHGSERITDRLNEVYTRVDSRLDPALARVQSAAVCRGDWWRPSP